MKPVDRKVLFVHDGPLYRDDLSGKLYGVHYDDKLIERYLFFGRHVTFLMRQEELPSGEVHGYTPLMSKNFLFIQIPNFKSFKNYFKNRKDAIEIIKNSVLNSDIIIVRLPSAAGIIAYKYAKVYCKPVHIELVACVYDALWNYDWRGKLMAYYKLFQYKRLIRDSKHTLYVTRKFLQSRYPTNGKSLACSDVELGSMSPEILEWRLGRIALTAKPYILGTIAALNVPYKGQKDVIKAIGILKKEGILFKYKLVGQGCSSFLIARAKEYDVEDLIEIIGPLPHDQIFDFLDTIDVYIQPSKQEGLPRALVEALSRACPSLGATTAGIPELIKSECIFRAGNVKQIVDKLKEVDKSWMHKHAHVNFVTAQEYRIEELAKRRRNFYAQFLNDWNLPT
jgi:glycosyltransferase involved in cell wall biosynthesis